MNFVLFLLLVRFFLFRPQTSSDHGASSNNIHFAKGNRKAAIIACKNFKKIVTTREEEIRSLLARVHFNL